MRRFMALIAAAGLAGCTVGPTYRSPAPSVPSQTPFVGATAGGFVPAEPPGEWWRLYDDPLLDGLIRQALTANTDLRVAAANLDRARAVLRETRGNALPTTGIGVGGTYGRQSAQALGTNATLPTGALYDAGLDASYQIDLFGGIRRGIEASRADLGAVQAAYDLTRITVAAETARAYVDACGAGQQLGVAERNVALQAQVYDLTRRLLEGGRGTALETGQAGSLLEQTRAQIPVLEAQRTTALYRLAVLTGRPPTDFPSDVAGCSALPQLRTPIPVGDGATLLARRPDIRQAERQLAAATARVGVATADLYPRVSIGGSVGSTATSIGGLGRSSAFRFGIGPLLSFSFPNLTVARARVAQAEATTRGALAQFDGTWLTALRETEGALTNYTREQERAAALIRARDQSREATRIAQLRFRAGREGFQIVLDAERQLVTAEGALAQSQAQVATNSVALFLALGGGWQP